LPGGGDSGSFGNAGYWWSATEYNASYAWTRNMYYSYEYVSRYSNGKTYLFSVCCVENVE